VASSSTERKRLHSSAHTCGRLGGRAGRHSQRRLSHWVNSSSLEVSGRRLRLALLHPPSTPNPHQNHYHRRNEGNCQVMRAYRLQQLEIKMAVGHRSDLVFTTIDGNPRSPDRLTTDWRRVSALKKLPSVNLHALRHTPASALIADGLDIMSVSRRLGHASPTITLSVYAHLSTKSDHNCHSAPMYGKSRAPLAASRTAPGRSQAS
jgi:integrase